MSSQRSDAEGFGVRGRLDWLVGGAIGGLVGAIGLGLVFWLTEPAIIETTIPSVYGLDSSASLGWVAHLLHGAIIGAIFGFLSVREPILGTLSADVETPILAGAGPLVRVALAGAVYGLAVWVVLPVFLVPFVLPATGPEGSTLPAVAGTSLFGHLLYGLLLGGVFAILVDLVPQATKTEAPFEEASDSPRE